MARPSDDEGQTLSNQNPGALFTNKSTSGCSDSPRVCPPCIFGTSTWFKSYRDNQPAPKIQVQCHLHCHSHLDPKARIPPMDVEPSPPCAAVAKRVERRWRKTTSDQHQLPPTGWSWSSSWSWSSPALPIFSSQSSFDKDGTCAPLQA